MLKSIQKLKGFGVFDNYSPPAGTSEFGVKNIIYGWNYSGKTTLSRLIASLEKKQAPADFPSCSFSIATDTSSITEANLASTTLKVRVFNTDFVADNINFAESHSKPILLLGSESERAQKEIDRFAVKLAKADKLAEARRKKLEGDKKTKEKAKTDAASSVKSTMSLVKAFGSNHLDKEITAARLLDADPRLSDEALTADLKLARSSDQDQLSPIPEISLNLNYQALHLESVPILTKKPNMASAIERLAQHPEIEQWVETGLPLHEGKTNCEFCGNPLDAKVLQTFREHFSKELADHKNEIDAMVAKLNSAKIRHEPIKAAELNAQFRDRYHIASQALLAAIATYDGHIQGLGNSLLQKKNAPFNPIAPPPLNETARSDLSAAVETLNAIVKENNEVSKTFPKMKEEAVQRLKHHFAAKFIDDEKLGAYEWKQARHSSHDGKYKAISKSFADQIAALKAIISQAQLGKEKINEMIERLLGNGSIRIDVVKVGTEERFQLVRSDGKPAKNLSEGEKTAIAFAFFMTKLRELDDLSQAVIWIDDPISSLDSNHIFQLNAIINEAFFHKAFKANGDKEQWTTRCKQIFFSTHNFEFFSLLRDLKPTKSNAAKLFLVKKVSQQSSTFMDMPKSMSGYSSEYHFLYDVLHQFDKSPDKTDIKTLMLLPNAVRRFMELYTYSKYPDGKDIPVDGRAERIFGAEKAKRILKVFHYFSHANNIEQISKNNDLMCDIEGAVADLMKHLTEMDPVHLEALNAAVGTSP